MLVYSSFSSISDDLCLYLFIALCICAEQTFTEASEQRGEFAKAFSTALTAYTQSSVRQNVTQAIGQLVAKKESDKRIQMEQLYQIIINHRLRMCFLFKSCIILRLNLI